MMTSVAAFRRVVERNRRHHVEVSTIDVAV
jgi:hypothetical protein